MGTLGTRARNGKKPARRVERGRGVHPAVAKLAAALKELKDTGEQQAATAEILKIISSSPGDPGPVFDAILRSALQLCDAHLGLLNLYDGERLRTVAQRGGSGKFAKWLFERGAFKPDGGAVLQAISTRQPVQVADARTSAGYRERKPNITRFVDLGRVRTFLAVPLVKDDRVIGNLGIYRPEVRPFTKKQIALVTMFAHQAVIAIENVRLFNETKEALERQTATAEILKVISASPTDVQPVFDIIGKLAAKLCAAEVSVVSRFDGELIRLAALHGIAKGAIETLRKAFPMRPDDETLTARAFRNCAVEHVADVLADPGYARKQAARAGGYRGALAVPMVREGQVIGVIFVARATPGYFTDAQVELLRTFADQAVIAIENVRLFNETKEALERQTASADVLRVIGGSPSDLQPVFDAILENAMRLCDASLATVGLYDGKLYRHVAQRGGSPEYVKFLFAEPFEPSPQYTLGRVIAERQPFHTADYRELPAYQEGNPRSVATVELGGARTFLAVPMLKDGQVIGGITLRRTEVRPFAQKQIDLVKSFADQAVIAIENARLFNETKEALERQTATAEILKVISASPTATQPVFGSIVQKCHALFEGSRVALWLISDGQLFPRSTTSFAAEPMPIDRESAMGACVLEARTIHLPDLEAAAGQYPRIRQLGLKWGHRSGMYAPLLREGRAIGGISVLRPKFGAFSDKEVALLTTFADQAVIAIENARLFNETREALERQTATSEVLRTISRSTFDLNAVLQVLIENATRLAGAQQGFIFRFDGEVARLAYSYNAAPAYRAFIEATPLAPGRGSLVGRILLERRAVHIPDALADPEFTLHEAQRAGGFRSMLGVPMMREGKLIGVIAVWATEVKPFTDKQMELVSTFADQAVIAIENVRLFNETKEALEQQTATVEILKTISSSPTDVQPVFEAIVRRATALCEAAYANVFRYDGEQLHWVTSDGWPPDLLSVLQSSYPRKPDRSRAAGRVILDKQAVQVEDTRADASYDRDLAGKLRYRRILGVPLTRSGEVIGAITVGWADPGPIEQRHEDLLKTFAQQAVIAIENVRLFNETKEALEQQTATAEILKAISSSPTDVQPVFEAIVRSGVRLFKDAAVAVTRPDGGQLRLMAIAEHDRELAAKWAAAYPSPVDRAYMHGAAVLDCAMVEVDDALQEVEGERFPVGRRKFAATGYRAITVMPMVRDGTCIGTVGVVRVAPGPLSEKQKTLLRTFADQAVIAIENVRLFNETKEALERQTATSAVLRVISGSPDDLAPVFAEILEHATRLCEAEFGFVFTSDGQAFDPVAQRGLDATKYAAWSDAFRPHRVPGPLSGLGRLLATKAPVLVADIADDEAYRARDPLRVLTVEVIGARTFLAVPLLKESAVIGAVVIYRREVRPFSEKQVALLQTFADQAVIAIENVRLFNATKEALEHQTATAEVLQVISGSVADAKPVFTKILQSCQSLFARGSVALALLGEDDMMHLHLIPEDPGRPVEDWRRRFRRAIEAAHPRPARDSISGHAMHKGQVLYYADVANGADVPSGLRESVELVGANYSMVSSPLLWEGRGIGALNVVRAPPAPFSEKEIRLLQTFADQAVIAIQNARLFNETKEALERQTATAEILRVISSSPTDTQPVFDAIVNSSQRLIAGKSAVLLLRHDPNFVVAAYAGPEVAHLPDEVRVAPLDRDKNFPSRAILDGEIVHVPDWQGDDVIEHERNVGKAFGIRSGLMVPLLREGKGIGAIAVTRGTPGPYHEKEVALLRSFADQAVIAIENVRLFNETKEALERQTATAEILKVISSSPTEIQPVFDVIVERAVRLCGARFGRVYRYDGSTIQMVASHGLSAIGLGLVQRVFPRPAADDTIVGRVILTRRPYFIEDIERDSTMPALSRQMIQALDTRSQVTIPMLRAGEPIGAITLGWAMPSGFGDQQVALLQTFADQAVIAIENVRLFKELQERTEALTKSVDQLTALGEVGQAISSTLDPETVLKTIVSRAVQLTGLNGGTIYEFDELRREFHLRAAENMPDELAEVYRRMPIRLGEGIVGGAAAKREPVQVPDIQDPSYQTRYRELLLRQGYRAILAVPLLREDQIIGALTVSRNEPGAFAPEVIELLKTFAAQSAVAIQNARLFREIAEKSRELELASRHKSQFLASMSHELRTPLNAILGFNEMILGQVYGEVPQDMKEPLEDIQKSGKHLLRLINNVLDLAKIEAGKMELALADYSVQDTVESVRSTLRPLAEAKGLELVASVAQDIPLAYGDGGRLTQCLMNLAGNSLKFTKQGRVEIVVEVKEGRLTWCVSDTGIGIPPDKIATLFSEFRQTDATIASEYGGTGLGLSITKKFVEMHGGRIWVESEWGAGSAFMFEVPLRVTTA